MVPPAEIAVTPARPGDRDRGGLVRRRAVAELAVGVVAPAVDGAVGEEGAGVVRAGGDRGDAREAGDGDRGESVRRRPVAELAVAL